MTMAISSACSCASSRQSPPVSSTVRAAGRCDRPANIYVSKLVSDVFVKGVERESLKRVACYAGGFSRGRSTAGFNVRATIAAREAPAKVDLSKLKADLLIAVAGLDRGLVAEEADEFAANEAAQKLEAAAGDVDFPENLGKLNGRWRLVFTSGFFSGSYGGQRPGPSITRSPFLFGVVYQRIDVANRELDNIVDLRFPAPWPLPPLEITATLAHSLEVAGGSKIKIVFEKTSVKVIGAFQLPQFELPKLPEFIRARSDSAGEFETTYLDDDFRISRGDRGELRVFVKA